MPGMLEVAFVRSPVAHARIVAIDVPADLAERVFIAKDMKDVRAIRATATLPGFQISEQPVLAVDRVRFVGETVAMCTGRTRAEAEDAADRVKVEYEELTAV